MIAEGAGARSRFAIGIVIAFGMSIGTMFTLFVTPAVYTLIARDHSRGRTAHEGPEPRLAGEPASGGGVEAPHCARKICGHMRRIETAAVETTVMP